MPYSNGISSLPKPLRNRSIKGSKTCDYCHGQFAPRGFRQHETACRQTYERKQHFIRANSRRFALHTSMTELRPGQQAETPALHEAVDDFMQEDIPPPRFDTPDKTAPLQPSNVEDSIETNTGPDSKPFYIRVAYHQRSGKRDRIIRLAGKLPADLEELDEALTETSTVQSWIPTRHETQARWSRPWTPFRTRANYEVARTMIRSRMDRKERAKMLRGLTGVASEAGEFQSDGYTRPYNWFGGSSNITLRSPDDLDAVMEEARKLVMGWRRDTVTIECLGKTETYEYYWREPMEYLAEIVTDPTLMADSNFCSVIKYLVRGMHQERMVDEPWTGDAWKEIDDALPPDLGGVSSVFAPFHVWRDKGNVSRRVQLYPMVIRPAWLSSKIRNASGHGGGIIICFFPIVMDPRDSKDQTPKTRLAIACARSEMHQKIDDRVFAKMRKAGRQGAIFLCGDHITRALHPGIFIFALDSEEACHVLGCRAASANFPCAKCLVPNNKQHRLDLSFPRRTVENMKAQLMKARAAHTKEEYKTILKDFGMHDIELSTWKMSFCDPYRFWHYDDIHIDWLGGWGGHLWKLTHTIVVEDLKIGARLNAMMSRYPRWSGLKHFQNVTKVTFTDARQHFDILKCIVSCIHCLFGKNSALVRCIRAYQMYCIMTNMKVMTETRVKHLREYIKQYYKWCNAVSKKYGKDFNFPKQHLKTHVVDDLWDNGVLINSTTKVDKGMHQEVRDAWELTNKRDVIGQVTKEDANQEAITRIEMHTDAYDAAEARLVEERRSAAMAAVEAQARLDAGHGPDSTCWVQDSEASDAAEELYRLDPRIPGDDDEDDVTYKLRGPAKRITTSHLLEKELKTTWSAFDGLDRHLREFLNAYYPNEVIGYGPIKIRTYSGIDVKYTSKEDFREARDILHCSPKFFGRQRYDSVLLNLRDVKYGRLEGLFRITLPSNLCLDLCLVTTFKSSSWKPDTLWQGCKVVEEAKPRFLRPEYIVRGALLVDIDLEHGPTNRYFVEDTVDNDMFLRLNDIDM